jgi:hypothetical protein
MRAFSGSVLDRKYEPLGWSLVLNSIQANVARDIARFSDLYEISPVDLKARVLLHLPRYSPEELSSPGVISNEIERLAIRTMGLQGRFKAWANQEPISRFESARALVTEASEDTAKIIHERFHYISSFRRGRHFALRFMGQEAPAVLATVSEMDVQKLKPHLPTFQENRTLLLSRMFSFRWAPLNSISYLLGAVGRWLRKEGQIDSLVTWVNPNVGFRASSYRAANWQYVGHEPTVYRYIEGNYVTARQLYRDSQALSSTRVDTSKLRLEPLQVWYRRIII